MPWAKFTDGLDENDKLAGIADPAFRLWVLAITWSNRKLTDGHIPNGRPMRLVSLRNPKKTTAELVEAKLWHLASRPCRACLEQRAEKKVLDPIPSGGWLIHDYFHFQKARWVIEAERERLRSIGAKGGKASTQLSTELSTQVELAAKHAAQAPSLAGSSSAQVELAARARSSTPYPRNPVPPSSGAIAPVPAEPPVLEPDESRGPKDADRLRDQARGRGRLRAAGDVAGLVAAEARGRAG